MAGTVECALTLGRLHGHVFYPLERRTCPGPDHARSLCSVVVHYGAASREVHPGPLHCGIDPWSPFLVMWVSVQSVSLHAFEQPESRI
jgi:hypothetical protein